MVARNSRRDGSSAILVVGAGPTGLTLAAQLSRFDVSFRIIDRASDRAHESRALAVQARSLEVLQALGLGEVLVSRGNPSARVALHFEGGRAAEVELGGFAAEDTRFPFILFVSQAETERVLIEHLHGSGVAIERGVELVDAVQQSKSVQCLLRHHDGHTEQIAVRYLVGCDGAHSTVRKQAGVAFEGDAYGQEFMLGDVEVDGELEPGKLHSFAARGGVAMFFPLGRPAPWRVIAMAGDRASTKATVGPAEAASAIPTTISNTQLSLAELQAVVDRATGSALQLRDPVWLSNFRLHHRQARSYRAGQMFLAGDAAHIHSPVGAQGMNTGIQDAWNLGWKLALVELGSAHESLLDSYHAERWPVGRTLLRYTDRAFSAFVRVNSSSELAAWFRRTVVARAVPRVLRSGQLRSLGFRFVSQLGIRYRKGPLATEGRPHLRHGPRAGDRLPDARVERAGQSAYLQQELSGPAFHVLLCSAAEDFDRAAAEKIVADHAGLVAVHVLTRGETPFALVDKTGEAFTRLGLNAERAAQYLVRPDGYIAFRCAGRDLDPMKDYLARWQSP